VGSRWIGLEEMELGRKRNPVIKGGELSMREKNVEEKTQSGATARPVHGLGHPRRNRPGVPLEGHTAEGRCVSSVQVASLPKSGRVWYL
jgi:hypothetical protein